GDHRADGAAAEALQGIHREYYVPAALLGRVPRVVRAACRAEGRKRLERGLRAEHVSAAGAGALPVGAPGMGVDLPAGAGRGGIRAGPGFLRAAQARGLHFAHDHRRDADSYGDAAAFLAGEYFAAV